MSDYFDFFDDETKGKNFNTTGVCSRDKHYMVNINHKLKEIIKLIQSDKYFVMNRPRQFGKTTTLNELEKILKTRYEVIKLDFEGLGNIFQSEKDFCTFFSKKIAKNISEYIAIVYNFKDNFITSENGLDMAKILLKFQQFMKENYSTRDKEFLERQGVLLFLSFIKPIINGVGLDKGYLLIFNFNKNKDYISTTYKIYKKEIFEVMV